MRFDCSPNTQEAVRTMLGLDPRMIKFGVVKLGDGTLKGIKDYEGKVKWNQLQDETDMELARLGLRSGRGQL